MSKPWTTRRGDQDRVSPAVSLSAGERRFTAVLRPEAGAQVPGEARQAVVDAADGLLRDGPAAGTTPAPELPCLQHLTLLATAWFLTREQPYAQRVADQLRSCWRETLFLPGVRPASGIELGIRLISLTWIRRLLADWSGVSGLFERDPLALHHIRWHQEYLAAFPGRGPGARRDLIAEAAGQLVASCAFPWFPESDRWRRKSALLLERELVRLTFPSGIGRELAADYPSLIAELGLIAATEAEASGYSLSAGTWQRLCAMVDSAAALVDGQLRAARQADSGVGYALLLDAPLGNRWPSFLALGEVLLGRLDWWPRVSADARSSMVGILAGRKHEVGNRPGRRPSRFADAGVTLLRTAGVDSPEIWCRCDGGPSPGLGHCVQIRYAGVDILADPGAARRRAELAWRRNRLGPARAREIEVIDDGDIASWTAEHHGCASLAPSARHRRSVLLDRASRSIDIVDMLGGGHVIRMAFRLGPQVRAELGGSCAMLNWPAAAPGAARLELPPGLRWSLHHGGTDLPGWDAADPEPGTPAATLLGQGRALPGMPLITRLEFVDAGTSAKSAVSQQAVSWTTSVSWPGEALEIGMEAR